MVFSVVRSICQKANVVKDESESRCYRCFYLSGATWRLRFHVANRWEHLPANASSPPAPEPGDLAAVSAHARSAIGSASARWCCGCAKAGSRKWHAHRETRWRASGREEGCQGEGLCVVIGLVEVARAMGRLELKRRSRDDCTGYWRSQGTARPTRAHPLEEDRLWKTYFVFVWKHMFGYLE